MRRSILAVAAILGASLAVGFLATPATARTVRIGIITTYSGYIAEAGEEMDKGLSLYAQTHEKDLPPGVKVELLKRDDTASPEVGKRLAQELITRDHVQILAGLVSSPVAAAIAPLTVEAKIPLVLMLAGGEILPRLSPYIVRVSLTLWQEVYPLGTWAAKQGWKRGYIAVSDYIPGHDAQAAFAKAFANAGGNIVGAVRFPPAALDYTPYIERVKDMKPDFVFMFVPAGEHATAMMKNANDIGLRKAGIRIISTQDLVPEEELPNMGDLPIGVVTAGTYSVAAKRPANEAFLAAWKRAYNGKAIPDYISVFGWDGMAAIFDVIKQTNGKFTGDQAMAILSHWKDPNSPRGPIAIDPKTRNIIQNVYLRRTEKVDNHLANVEFDTIPQVMDPWNELYPLKK